MEPENWTDYLDERQQKEVAFSRLYAKDFGHGTDGHNAKVIIAKLADLLDAAQAARRQGASNK